MPAAMDSKHPLAVANKWLDVACSTAIAASKEAQSQGAAPVLLYKDCLRMSSCFTGMGGAEFAAYLVGEKTGLRLLSVSHCDVLSDSMKAFCRGMLSQGRQGSAFSLHYIFIYI